jgi:hypothetical protein
MRAFSGDAPETAWIQRLSIAIQRGNAASVLSTTSQNPKTGDDSYLS